MNQKRPSGKAMSIKVSDLQIDVDVWPRFPILHTIPFDLLREHAKWLMLMNQTWARALPYLAQVHFSQGL